MTRSPPQKTIDNVIHPNLINNVSASLPSPLKVGGRLQHFVEEWKSIGAPESVLKIISGYSLPFVTQPPVSLPSTNSFTRLSQPELIRVVDEEVESLLNKGAIEEVPASEPGYFSHLFCVPKPDGKWRPILNLKKLNSNHLEVPHFRMDTIRDVALLIRQNDFAASVDLKDAYFQIPINRRHRRFLRFGWKKKLYQFLVLPFGLSPAPLIFTRVTKPLKAFLQAKRIRLIIYLDDILILGATEEECRNNVDELLHLLHRLGFIVNYQKSSLSPSRKFRFLGLDWDTKAGLIGIDEIKRLAIVTRASTILKNPQPRCRDLQRLLGHMTAANLAVPLLRLHSRYLQRDLNKVYATPKDLERRVSLSTESLRDLTWTSCLEPRQCVKQMWPLQMESCNVEVSTDASDFAWGIYFEGRLLQGKWTDVDARRHINVKELSTLKIFLTDFLPQSKNGCELLWRTDSSTSLAYIKKEGGTVSATLMAVAREILLILHRRNIRILPVFVKSEVNLLADAASRFIDLPDWHLPSSIFNRISDRWSKPQIDLFATMESTHLPRFFAWGNDEGAEAFDALAQSWDFHLAYAFPPPPLLPRVIDKIAASTGSFILITPFWPAQKWFPVIQTLKVEEVRRLPEEPPVLDLKTGEQPLRTLPLLSWKIIGGCEVSTSRKRPLDLSEIVGESLQGSGMQQRGVDLRNLSPPEMFRSIPLI